MILSLRRPCVHKSEMIEIDGRKFTKVLNLDEETIKILRFMGEEYEKYYS
jgi:hypothetical protein